MSSSHLRNLNSEIDLREVKMRVELEKAELNTSSVRWTLLFPTVGILR